MYCHAILFHCNGVNRSHIWNSILHQYPWTVFQQNTRQGDYNFIFQYLCTTLFIHIKAFNFHPDFRLRMFCLCSDFCLPPHYMKGKLGGAWALLFPHSKQRKISDVDRHLVLNAVTIFDWLKNKSNTSSIWGSVKWAIRREVLFGLLWSWFPSNDLSNISSRSRFLHIQLQKLPYITR